MSNLSSAACALSKNLLDYWDKEFWVIEIWLLKSFNVTSLGWILKLCIWIKLGVSRSYRLIDFMTSSDAVACLITRWVVRIPQCEVPLHWSMIWPSRIPSPCCPTSSMPEPVSGLVIDPAKDLPASALPVRTQSRCRDPVRFFVTYILTSSSLAQHQVWRIWPGQASRTQVSGRSRTVTLLSNVNLVPSFL